MSADTLQKGAEVNLTDQDPSLKRVFVGMGWDVPEKHDGVVIDLDASAFLLTRENRVRRDTDFIFYNNLEGEDGAIAHKGDSITGEGDGDDEVVAVALDKIPFDVDHITFSVTLHNASERGHHFGLVRNAFIRVVNEDTGVELARYDLSEDAADQNGVVFGALERDGSGWKFKAIGQGTDGGLYRIARDFGVNVAPP